MLGYKQGKDLYADRRKEDIEDEDMHKYYITIYNDAYFTDSTADKLNMPLDKFIEFLYSCGAVKNSAGCLCFANEDDIIKTIIMLQLII